MRAKEDPHGYRGQVTPGVCFSGKRKGRGSIFGEEILVTVRVSLSATGDLLTRDLKYESIKDLAPNHYV